MAGIVAETMHNYLLLGHLLQCHVMDDSQLHPNMWIGANRKFRPYPALRVAREKCNSVRDTRRPAMSSLTWLTRLRMPKHKRGSQAVCCASRKPSGSRSQLMALTTILRASVRPPRLDTDAKLLYINSSNP